MSELLEEEGNNLMIGQWSGTEGTKIKEGNKETVAYLQA